MPLFEKNRALRRISSCAIPMAIPHRRLRHPWEGKNVFVSIKKRNGIIVPFRPDKITTAIARAGEATAEFDEEIAGRLTLRVLNLAQQALPGASLRSSRSRTSSRRCSSPRSSRHTAKAYIIYRDQHARIREIVSRADVDLIDQYLERADWQVNENSNMGYSLQGLNNYVSSEISKIYWLNKIYPPPIRLAHTEGDFHIHDLGILSVYCVGWDLEDLLLQGFKGAAGKGGKQAGEAPAQRPRPGRQLLLYSAGRGGRRAGFLTFRHAAGALHPLRRPGLRRGEAGPAGVRFQHQRAHPCRVPDALHQHHPGPQGPAHMFRDKPVISGREYLDETYCRVPGGNGRLQPRLPGGALRGRRQGPRVHLPHPTYNITKDFPWDDPRAGYPLAGDGALRHSLFLQLRELGHVPRGHPLHVLPAAAGPPRAAAEQRPWRNEAAAFSARTR